MLLFVGLGNPGSKYDQTPHNAGYLYVDTLREMLGWTKAFEVDDWKEDSSFESFLSFGRSGQEIRFILAKPTTFMNLSGRAASKIVKKFGVNVSKELVLIHDDLDLRLGSTKIQREKSPRDHRGVKSIEDALGSINFLRVRVGVDNREDGNRIPGEDYVLGKYKEDEIITLNQAINDSISTLRDIVEL